MMSGPHPHSWPQLTEQLWINLHFKYSFCNARNQKHNFNKIAAFLLLLLSTVAEGLLLRNKSNFPQRVHSCSWQMLDRCFYCRHMRSFRKNTLLIIESGQKLCFITQWWNLKHVSQLKTLIWRSLSSLLFLWSHLHPQSEFLRPQDADVISCLVVIIHWSEFWKTQASLDFPNFL